MCSLGTKNQTKRKPFTSFLTESSQYCLQKIPPRSPSEQVSVPGVRCRGCPAVRDSCAAGQPEVCPHGVPGAGQRVRQRVEARACLHPPHDVPLEPGD